MRRPHVVQGVVAGLGIVVIELWPVILIWRAGASGSVGDLSELNFLWFGLTYSVVFAVGAGFLMGRALTRAAASSRLGRFDPWGAYALGVGVHTLALTALPALMLGILLADENQSIRGRVWLVQLIWIAGHLVAATIAVLAARALLGRAEPSGEPAR